MYPAATCRRTGAVRRQMRGQPTDHSPQRRQGPSNSWSKTHVVSYGRLLSSDELCLERLVAPSLVRGSKAKGSRTIPGCRFRVSFRDVPEIVLVTKTFR